VSFRRQKTPKRDGRTDGDFVEIKPQSAENKGDFTESPGSQTEGIRFAYNETGDRNDIRETDMKTIFSSYLTSRGFSNPRTHHLFPTSV